MVFNGIMLGIWFYNIYLESISRVFSHCFLKHSVFSIIVTVQYIFRIKDVSPKAPLVEVLMITTKVISY